MTRTRNWLRLLEPQKTPKTQKVKVIAGKPFETTRKAKFQRRSPVFRVFSVLRGCTVDSV